LSGGKAGRLGATWLNHGTRKAQRLHSKGVYRLAAGDLLSWQTAGAGGFGNPLRRAPEAVLRDVRNGLVSVTEAARTYGVVIDAKGLAVDAAATARRRKRTNGKRRTA
jgi:N-methylhydantoinase B